MLCKAKKTDVKHIPRITHSPGSKRDKLTTHPYTNLPTDKPRNLTEPRNRDSDYDLHQPLATMSNDTVFQTGIKDIITGVDVPHRPVSPGNDLITIFSQNQKSAKVIDLEQELSTCSVDATYQEIVKADERQILDEHDNCVQSYRENDSSKDYSCVYLDSTDFYAAPECLDKEIQNSIITTEQNTDDTPTLYTEGQPHDTQSHTSTLPATIIATDTDRRTPQTDNLPASSTDNDLINERFISLLVRDTLPLSAEVTNISIKGSIYGYDMAFLIDTGASVSAIKGGITNQIPQLALTTPNPTSIKSIRSVSGDVIAVQGQLDLPFTIGDYDYPFKALVINRMAYDAILGCDFLQHYKAKIDLEHQTLTISNDSFLFPTPPSAIPDNTSDVEICFVQAQSSFIIPPSTEVVVPADLEYPAAKGATGIMEPRQEFVSRYQLAGAAELVTVWENNTVPVRLLNPTNQPVRIYRKTRLGQVSFVDPEIAAFDLHKADLKAEASREVPTAVDRDPPIPLDINADGLTTDQQAQLQTLLTKYRDVFAYTPDQLGRSSTVKHIIDTPLSASGLIAPRQPTKTKSTSKLMTCSQMTSSPLSHHLGLLLWC